ncbi:MAG: hypothetical protein U0354_19400 [Candidatus Sericytochromatia bacterium]
MCPVIGNKSNVVVDKPKTTKPKQETVKTETPVKENPVTVLAPQDKTATKKYNTSTGSATKEISFAGKISPKTTAKTEEKKEMSSTLKAVKGVKTDAHNVHTGYEIAASSQKVVSKLAGGATKMSRVLLLSSELEGFVSNSNLAKAKAVGGSTTGKVGITFGKVLKSTANVLNEAHHGTVATQTKVLNSTAGVLNKVGATTAASKLTKMAADASHVGHAAHGATTIAKTTATVAKTGSTAVKVVKTASVVAKTAGVVGKIMPGVGFAAGMVGAGFAVKDAMHAKTTTGKIVHGARAVLNVTAGVASFVPGVGTAVGLGATAVELGLGWAAKKFNW